MSKKHKDDCCCNCCCCTPCCNDCCCCCGNNYYGNYGNYGNGGLFGGFGGFGNGFGCGLWEAILFWLIACGAGLLNTNSILIILLFLLYGWCDGAGCCNGNGFGW